MKEENDLALVPRLPGALEKAEPGAERLLSAMVADTLALVKKEPPGKPMLTILVGGDDWTIEHFQTVIPLILDEFDVKFFGFGTESELIKVAEEQPFDLIVVYLHGVFWSEWRDGFVARAVGVLARLKAQYCKPIIAQQGMNLASKF